MILGTFRSAPHCGPGDAQPQAAEPVLAARLRCQDKRGPIVLTTEIGMGAAKAVTMLDGITFQL